MSGVVDVLKEAAARLPQKKWDDGQRALAAVDELLEALESSVPDLEYAVALAGSVNGLRANAISIRLCSVRAALANFASAS